MYIPVYSGGYRGTANRLRPPPFGRRTDAVTHFKILKMIATSGFLTAIECIKIVFGRGSDPEPAGGAYNAPQSPIWIKGALLLKGRGREGRGGKKRGRGSDGRGGGGRSEGRGSERREGKRRDRPPFRKFLDPPLVYIKY